MDEGKDMKEKKKMRAGEKNNVSVCIWDNLEFVLCKNKKSTMLKK